MKPRRLQRATISSIVTSSLRSLSAVSLISVNLAAAIIRRPVPIYEYRCRNGHTFEVIQKMSDPPVTTCEVCGAPVERVFHPVAVHFKGSGFYNTDYGKAKAKAGTGLGDGDSGSKDSGSKDSGGAEKSAKKDSGDRQGQGGQRLERVAADGGPASRGGTGSRRGAWSSPVPRCCLLGPELQADSEGQRIWVLPLEATRLESTSWLIEIAPMSLTKAFGASQPMIGPLMKL
jgi:putative FmdB family regulatory protein